MKICFIDWFAYALFNPKSEIIFGGAQIQLYLLTEELSKNKKFSVSFLTDNQKSNRQDKFNKIKVYQFVRSPKTPGIYGRFLNLLYRLPALGYIHFFIRLLIQLKKINAQVYFQRAASAETGLVALIAKILRRKFIFMVAHQNDVNGQFIKQNGWRGKLFLLGLKLADKIICQTIEQQNQLSDNLKAKSLLILSGYPIKPINLIKQKKQGILWVARAEDWKKPDLFIKLAKKFPKEKFTMICPPAENCPKYFDLIKVKAKKVKNLIFISQVPFRKIDNYFAKARIFISTSESEGFPNTFIQAGLNMAPIISFKVNPDKIIDKHQIGLCAEGNEGQMIILLKKLLENPQLRKRLAANAYHYARQYHDIEKTAANIIENIL